MIAAATSPDVDADARVAASGNPGCSLGRICAGACGLDVCESEERGYRLVGVRGESEGGSAAMAAAVTTVVTAGIETSRPEGEHEGLGDALERKMSLNASATLVSADKT